MTLLITTESGTTYQIVKYSDGEIWFFNENKTGKIVELHQSIYVGGNLVISFMKLIEQGNYLGRETYWLITSPIIDIEIVW